MSEDCDASESNHSVNKSVCWVLSIIPQSYVRLFSVLHNERIVPHLDHLLGFGTPCLPITLRMPPVIAAIPSAFTGPYAGFGFDPRFIRLNVSPHFEMISTCLMNRMGIEIYKVCWNL
jgi:hypothetical protein